MMQTAATEVAKQGETVGFLFFNFHNNHFTSTFRLFHLRILRKGISKILTIFVRWQYIHGFRASSSWTISVWYNF